MSRSGYSSSEDGDCDSNVNFLWPSIIERSITGKRGQDFLRELAAAMDAMPVKELIAEELVTPEGECCTMGVVCKARGLDVSKIDYDADDVGKALGIAPTMAREIAHLNDDDFGYEKLQTYNRRGRDATETPAERWTRMRAWVAANLVDKGTISENVTLDTKP